MALIGFRLPFWLSLHKRRKRVAPPAQRFPRFRRFRQNGRGASPGGVLTCNTRVRINWDEIVWELDFFNTLAFNCMKRRHYSIISAVTRPLLDLELPQGSPNRPVQRYPHPSRSRDPDQVVASPWHYFLLSVRIIPTIIPNLLLVGTPFSPIFGHL